MSTGVPEILVRSDSLSDSQLLKLSDTDLRAIGQAMREYIERCLAEAFRGSREADDDGNSSQEQDNGNAAAVADAEDSCSLSHGLLDKPERREGLRC